MSDLINVNDMVVRFANVNGTGSSSANEVFSKAIFRMGIPVSPKNIFPSNIQGLPTWYEVRVSEKGYLGRRDGIDILVGVNPQSLKKDIASVKSGGYFVYDSTKILHDDFIRPDIHMIGIPMMQLSMDHYELPRMQQLFKNIIYVGALATLIDLDLDVVKSIISEQFEKKPKLIPPNFKALDLGADWVKENCKYPLNCRLKKSTATKDKILMEGNAGTGLGAVYAGATVLSWYPITPSTSVAKDFEDYAKKYRVDPVTGKNNFAIIQAEDELAAFGMALGANWNGARAFTATSGPGISLMNEFIGLAYFAEVPMVVVNVQRGGPSTGMPTRTQQSDLLLCAYASHGDTKHVMLFPSTPTECFELTADAFDLADELQTVVFVMTDLDLGMNIHMTEPLKWDDNRKFKRGKVLNYAELEATKNYARFLDVDGDGVGYRVIPGTHPTKGAYLARGTSHDSAANYTEDGNVHASELDRIMRKFETAKDLVPEPVFYQQKNEGEIGIVFFGTTTYAALEAMEILEQDGAAVDAMRIKSFPFNDAVKQFIDAHETVYVIEQNRDAQCRSLLLIELGVDASKLKSILNYDGMPITADAILKQLKQDLNGQIKTLSHQKSKAV
jgi:2-oxoglutarate ferredoxin oxidoreductase subunit alpha